MSLTLSANFDLLAAKIEEHVLRPLSLTQSVHSATAKRVTDDLSRAQRQLTAMTDTLTTSKAASKKACQELTLWLLEHRERERALRPSSADAAEVNLHSVFDELVHSFRWDADSLKKRTLSIDARYIAAVKALRSYRPQHDALLRSLLAEAQGAEEERKRSQLSAVQTYCDIQCALFDKYVRSVKAVKVMGAQVNVRREMRGWIKERRGEGKVEPLPEYIMHKGHPQYEETEEEEERHDHEGITEDEDEEDDAENDEEEEEDDDEDEEEEEEEDEEDEEEEEESVQSRMRRQRRRRQRGADELDEREDEKTEERIIGEKVLRVFVDKAIGHSSDASAHPAVELHSPPSASLTAPLPRSALLPISPERIGQGVALDADEERAAKAIFSTRDGRNAFATIFSSLSPTFHGSRLPLSLFSAFDGRDGPTLTLPAASFVALTSLTNLFLDAALTAFHIEPALFVANVAHQLVRVRGGLAAAATPAAPSDDVMRKEEVEGAESGRTTLLSHLSSHPLLGDARFFSSGLFSSLHHRFAHRSLYMHRWHSDAEQDAVLHERKALTFALLAQFTRMMDECGVARRERRRFLEKQLRVFDLAGAEWKDQAATVRTMAQRGLRDAEEEDEEGSEEHSPLDIDGLREAHSDSEEEKKAALLKKKEEERAVMAAQKADDRRKKRRARPADAADPNKDDPAAVTAAAAAARRKREAEERKRREEEEEAEKKKAEEEAARKKKAPSFFATSLSSLQSSLFKRSPSPAPALQAAAGPVKEAGKMTIPIPVASAVPASPVVAPAVVKAAAKDIKSDAPRASAPVVAEVKRKKRVVRRPITTKSTADDAEEEKSEQKNPARAPTSPPSATAAAGPIAARPAAPTREAVVSDAATGVVDALNDSDDMP